MSIGVPVFLLLFQHSAVSNGVYYSLKGEIMARAAMKLASLQNRLF